MKKYYTKPDIEIIEMESDNLLGLAFGSIMEEEAENDMVGDETPNLAKHNYNVWEEWE